MKEKKRGRPAKNTSMRNQYRLMMDDDFAYRLNNFSRLSGKTQADLLRTAFDIYEKENISRYETAVEEDDYWEYDEYYSEEDES